MRTEERDFGWSKVKVSSLHLLWFDVKSVEERKEEKVKEIKGKGHSAIWELGVEWKSKVPECDCVSTGAVLKNRMSEWASKREEKNCER